MTEQIMDMARSLGHVDGGQEEAQIGRAHV